jgi:hypothetical protein
MVPSTKIQIKDSNQRFERWLVAAADAKSFSFNQSLQ